MPRPFPPEPKFQYKPVMKFVKRNLRYTLVSVRFNYVPKESENVCL